MFGAWLKTEQGGGPPFPRGFFPKGGGGVFFFFILKTEPAAPAVEFDDIQFHSSTFLLVRLNGCIGFGKGGSFGLLLASSAKRGCFGFGFCGAVRRLLQLHFSVLRLQADFKCGR